MLNELPLKINPKQLCQSGAHLVGKVDVGLLKNFFEARVGTLIEVDLVFAVDEEGYRTIKGEIKADLPLICQRCLQSMVQPITGTVSVSPVTSDSEAKRLPACYEPLLVVNQEVIMAQWIAEELHLALPLVPRHDINCVSYKTFNGNS